MSTRRSRSSSCEAHRLLVATDPRPRSERRCELELEATTSAPAEARRAVEELVADQSDAVRFNLRLLVSELVGNSVRHGVGAEASTVRVVAVREGRRLQVQVIDRGHTFEWTRRPNGEGGRGLPLVAALASRWGLTFDRGTTAWFELALGAGSRTGVATLDS